MNIAGVSISDGPNSSRFRNDKAPVIPNQEDNTRVILKEGRPRLSSRIRRSLLSESGQPYFMARLRNKEHYSEWYSTKGRLMSNDLCVVAICILYTKYFWGYNYETIPGNIQDPILVVFITILFFFSPRVLYVFVNIMTSRYMIVKRPTVIYCWIFIYVVQNKVH